MSPTPHLESMVALAHQLANEKEAERQENLDFTSLLAAACEALRPRDMLSNLPPELLSPIFEEVRLKSGPYKNKLMVGAISKSLLHFTRRNLFHSVTIASQQSLSSFWRTMQENEDDVLALYLADQVKSLTVFGWCFANDHTWSDFRAATLLPRFSHLDKLCIRGAGSFLSCLRSPEVCQRLSSLTTLDISDPNYCCNSLRSMHKCATEPLSLESYRFLQYLKIEKLHISVFEDQIGHSDGSLDFLPMELEGKNASVKELSIIGSLDNLESQLIDFLGTFESLDTLCLKSVQEATLNSSYPLIPQCFGKVSSTLRHLLLNADQGRWATYRYDPIDEALRYLPNLVSLTIDVPNFSEQLFSLLPLCRHLERLHFGHHARQLTFTELESLLEPTGPAELCEIIIDNVTDEECRLLEKLVAESSGWSQEEFLSLKCHLPNWPLQLSCAKAVAFVSLAKESDIVVKGSILGAIRGQTAFDAAFKLRYPDLTAKKRRKLL